MVSEDDRRSSWQDIQAEILHRIRTRRWKPGDQIPNEAELAREFGCARATVNRALQAVADAGLLDRRRKAGTRVSELPVRRARLDIPIIRQQVENDGQAYGYHLVFARREVPTAEYLAAMGLQSRTRLLHLHAVHHAGNAPFVVEDRWINDAILPDVESADFSRISANEWLVQNALFTSGEIAFSACATPPEIASLLKTRAGDPSFTVDRLTWHEADPVTRVRLWYRPGYTLKSKL